MKLHDQEALTLDDLAGYEVRLNEPGGRHFEGVLRGQVAETTDADGKPAPPGTYELAFREPGTTAWANDARLPTIEV